MIRELQLRRRTGPAIISERVRVRLRRDEKVFDILRSVTFIATFASRAKSIAHVHDVHESLMFLPDCTLAFRGIFSSENRTIGVEEFGKTSKLTRYLRAFFGFVIVTLQWPMGFTVVPLYIKNI